MRSTGTPLFAVVCIFAGVLLVRAGAPQGPPKPGPEHEKLAYFVGKWTSEGEMKASQYGPAGKFSFTESCEWFDGHFAVVCHSSGTMMGMNIRGVEVLGYDMGEKNYVYFETNSIGENNIAHGTVDGDTWTWNGESKMNGATVRSRYTVKQTSQDVANYKFELAAGSDPMALLMEGQQTRQK